MDFLSPEGLLIVWIDSLKLSAREEVYHELERKVIREWMGWPINSWACRMCRCSGAYSGPDLFRQPYRFGQRFIDPLRLRRTRIEARDLPRGPRFDDRYCLVISVQDATRPVESLAM